MDNQSVDVFKPVLVDIITLAILGILQLFIGEVIKPYNRGFFCADESIRYPYHDSTVPSIALNLCSVGISLILFCFFEYGIYVKNRKNISPVYIGKYKISGYCWSVYKLFVCFGSGALFTELITTVGKKVIGRLRPNFISVCKPDLGMLCSANTYSYISTENICTSEDVGGISDSRCSFPSGHSSFAFYVAVFLVLYLQKRLFTRSLILKPTIQVFIIIVAWFVALSRVMDNKHHWSDVLVGITIGISVALINTLIVQAPIFETPKPTTTNGTTNGNRTNGVTHEAHDQL